MTAEQFAQSSGERGETRKLFDKAGRAAAFVALPLSIYVAGAAVMAGSLWGVAVGGGSAFLDWTQIKERNKASGEQSWYNPERLMDKIWKGNRGSNRFNQTSTRMAVSTSA